MRRVAAIVALVLVALLPAPRLAAQVGQTTDILTGTVTDSTKAPVENAQVTAVSLDTRVQRSTRTDARGRWRILFPDGGGRYQVFVTSLGMAPARLLAQREGDDDRIVVNVALSSRPVEMQEIVARGRQAPRGGVAITPGSTEQAQTPDRLARLPIDAGDLNAIAALAAGVVSIGGTDSTAAGFSIAGQRPTANNVTLDGLTFGASSIPQDAVRATRVITSTYDVARGQFSGGLVASTTRSGTNAFTATVTGNLRDPSLAVAADQATAQPGAQQQFSFGAGGPLRKDRLFLFGAGQVRHRDDRLISAATLDPVGAVRFGIASDSLARFLALVDSLGVPVTRVGIPDSRTNLDLSGIARLDWVLGPSHTLTLRGDWRHSDQSPSRLAALAVPATGGDQGSNGGGALVQLSSRLGGTFLNEAKAYLSGSSQSGAPYLALPQGRVQVTSTLPDGTTGFSTLVFGGSSAFPNRGSSTAFEASNELSWLPGDAAHRLKLGAFYTTTRTTQEVGTNLAGTFSYNSLADLAAGAPALFTRTLTPNERRGTSSTGALYLGDIWRLSGTLQVTYGVRAEHGWLGGAPAYNALVDTLFGLRTDRLPSETRVSPRVGFTWLERLANGPPRWIVRGGFGEFRSPVPQQLAVAAQSATGLDTGERQLVCAGPGAPSPDWSAYGSDASLVPSSCAAGGPLPAPSAAPGVVAFRDGFTAPRTWRTSLGATRRLGLFNLGLEVSRTWGEGQSGFEDANLGPARFTLVGEGGRLVFADPAQIDPRTGAAPLAASRLDDRFGQVFAITSRLTTRATQAVLSGSGIIGKGIVVNASYTWSRALDQSSFAFGGAAGGYASQTAGLDPRVLDRAPSDFDRRHQVVLTATVPVVRGFEVTTIGRLSSGAPFTPSVNGDINGDGARNDRAFIVNPATSADPALAAAFQKLLDEAPGRVRDCLARQLGRVADRNSCRGPWQPSLDLQLNWKPTWKGFDQRLTISLVTSNLLAGIDQLVHGADNLQGWGQFSRPDPTLLTVRGFDPNTQAFTYDVNDRFGQVRGTTNALRIPFQVGIQFRLALGASGLFGGFGGPGGGPGGGGFGGGGFGGGRGEFGGRPGEGAPGAGGAGGAPGAGAQAAPATPAELFASRFARFLPDPTEGILSRDVALRLTDDQVAKLKAISAQFIARRDSIAQVVRTEIEKAGPNPDPAVLFSGLRGKIEKGRTFAQAALDEAKGVLTAEQWAALPEEARTIRQGFGPGGGRRPPGQ